MTQANRQHMALSLVGQETLPTDPKPAKSSLSPVGQKGVHPYKKEVVGQSPTQPLLTRGASGVSQAKKRKRGASKDKRGRKSGGPACIGCAYYQAKRNSADHLIGGGHCIERGRDVAAVYRGACALYLFHAAARGRNYRPCGGTA